MARGTHDLRREAAKLICKPGRPFSEYTDFATVGLRLRVTKAGKREWRFRSGDAAPVLLGEFPAMDYAAARALAGKAHGAVSRGTTMVDVLAPLRGLTIRQVCDQHLVGNGHREKLARMVAPILDGWRDGAGDHQGIGDVPVAEVTREQIVGLVEALDFTGERDKWRYEAARRRVRTIAASVEFAMTDEATKKLSPTTPNVAEAILRGKDRRFKKRKTMGHKRRHTAEQVTAFRAAIDRKLSEWRPRMTMKDPLGWIMLELGLLVGARPGEIAKLRVSWLKDDHFEIALHKTTDQTAEPRVIMLSPDALAVLEKARRWRAILGRENSPYIFPSGVGDGHIMTAKAHMEVLREELGLDWVPHSLRSIFVNAMDEAGIDTMTIAAMIGDDPDTVRRHYMEVSEDKIARAKAVAGSVFKAKGRKLRAA